MKLFKTLANWLWNLQGDPDDWNHPKNYERNMRNMYGIRPGASSLEKEQAKNDLQVVLWSLDYHAHRIKQHSRGNPGMLEDINRLRKQLRNYL